MNTARIELMYKLLNEALAPESCEVIDEGHLQIEVGASGTKGRIVVIDKGMGINPKSLPHRYFRSRTTGRENALVRPPGRSDSLSLHDNLVMPVFPVIRREQNKLSCGFAPFLLA